MFPHTKKFVHIALPLKPHRRRAGELWAMPTWFRWCPAGRSTHDGHVSGERLEEDAVQLRVFMIRRSRLRVLRAGSDARADGRRESWAMRRETHVKDVE